MYLDLAVADTGDRVFLASLAPGPAATTLVGLMLGRVFHDPNPEIAVTRLVAVRLPGAVAPDPGDSDAYVHPAEESLSGDSNGSARPWRPRPCSTALLHGFSPARTRPASSACRPPTTWR
jgi:hypothetical protein